MANIDMSSDTEILADTMMAGYASGSNYGLLGSLRGAAHDLV
jgi:NADH:ubiquinone oxidoreductase subunit H